MVDYLNVGTIVNTQGLKGEVRVISMTDFPDLRYKKGNILRLFLPDGKGTVDLTIQAHRKHKNFDILRFEGYPSINDVEKFRDGVLKIAKDELNELEEDEFYYHEIIGLEVIDENGDNLGTVTEILTPGANDVWVVKKKGRKDIYLPYIESVVKRVDLNEGKVFVEIPEGLIDDEN